MADLVTPKTREALATYLHEFGIREGTFHLFGAHLDNAHVMDLRPEGWVVFYSERGGESSVAVHRDEADACADLLARVTSDDQAFFQLVAGPAPAAEADEAFETWLDDRGITSDDLNPTDWRTDDIPWVAGPYWRRYFVRITTVRRLAATS